MNVVLIDGWKGNHRRLDRLRQAVGTNVRSRVLEDTPTGIHRGEGAAIWSYDSSGRTDLEELGAALSTHLRALEGPVQVVAYSMGGLILREAVRVAPDLPIRRAAFLHTPHQGTILARTLTLPAVRQMRPGSAFLRRLDQAPWTVPTLNVWCPGDLIVVPGWNARWTRATREIRCDLPAHLWPIYSSGLHSVIRDFLREDREETGGEVETISLPMPKKN